MHCLGKENFLPPNSKQQKTTKSPPAHVEVAGIRGPGTGWHNASQPGLNTEVLGVEIHVEKVHREDAYR